MRLLNLLPFVLILMLLLGCAKEKDFPEVQNYPILRTLEVTPDSTGAMVSGEIVSLGNEVVMEYGFEYSSLNKNPIVTKVVVDTKAKQGRFEAKLTQHFLKENIYKVQAYAKHGLNTTYGSALTFRSLVTTTPVIHAFTPKAANDYEHVTIYGENFGADKALVKVTIGELQASIVSIYHDSIVFMTPSVSYSGTFPLSVSVLGKRTTAAEAFEIIGPAITHLSKSKGMPGDELIIHGKGFKNFGWSSWVSIGGKNATVLSHSETEIRVQVPSGTASTYDKALTVSVTIGKKTSALPYSFTLGSGFVATSNLSAETGVTQTPLPNFVADGKAFFFSFDRVISYTMATNSWKNEGMFPGIYRHSGIFRRVGNKGYLIGGRNGNTFYGDAWEYDYRQNSWTRLNNLPLAVSSSTNFVLNGKIHFFGGLNNSSTIKLWQYDPETQSIVGLNNFPNSSSSGHSFESNGFTYALLGTALWLYDAQQDGWANKAAIPDLSTFTNTLAFTYKNEGYALSVGGDYALYKYDTAQNTWSKVAFYPGCVTSSATFYGFATEDKLYIGTLGGCSPTLYSYEKK